MSWTASNGPTSVLSDSNIKSYGLEMKGMFKRHELVSRLLIRFETGCVEVTSICSMYVLT
jgi:hypothetical protein